MDNGIVYRAIRDRMAAVDLAVVEGTVPDGKHVDLRRHGKTLLRVLVYDADGGHHVNVAQADEIGADGDPDNVGGYVSVVRDGAERAGDVAEMLSRLDGSLARALGRPPVAFALDDVVDRLQAELRMTGASVRRWTLDGTVGLVMQDARGVRAVVHVRPGRDSCTAMVVRGGDAKPAWDDADARSHEISRPYDAAFCTVAADVRKMFADAPCLKGGTEADRVVARLASTPKGLDDLIRALAASDHAEAVSEGLLCLLDRPTP